MAINSTKLDQELKDAELVFSGCNSDGIVWDVDGTTEIQDRPAVAAVIAAHDPRDNVKERQESAEGDIKKIPNLSTMTAAEIEAWIDSNVTDIASIISFMKDLAKMEIAFRNNSFPGIPGLGPD